MLKDNPYHKWEDFNYYTTSCSVTERWKGPHTMVTTLDSWARLFKAQFSQPRISENFDFSFVTFQRGFLFIWLALQFWVCIIRNYPTYKQWKALILLLTFNLRLALTGFDTMRPRLSRTGLRPGQGHCFASSFIQKIKPWNYQKILQGWSYRIAHGSAQMKNIGMTMEQSDWLLLALWI